MVNGTKIAGVVEDVPDWDVSGQAEIEKQRKLKETGMADPTVSTEPEGEAQLALLGKRAGAPEEQVDMITGADSDTPLMMRGVAEEPTAKEVQRGQKQVEKFKPDLAPPSEYQKKKGEFALGKSALIQKESEILVAGQRTKEEEQATRNRLNQKFLIDAEERRVSYENAANKRRDDLEAEFGRIKEMTNQVFTQGGGDIDPDRYLGSGLTPKRIGAAISIFLASFGGPESTAAAMGNINKAVDRDIAAQKFAIETGKQAIAGQRNLYADMLSLYKTEDMAHKATELAFQQNFQRTLDARAATAKTQQERDNVNKLILANNQKQLVIQEDMANLDPTKLNTFVQPHQVVEKEQKEKFVSLGKNGGFYATNKEQAKIASKAMATYAPALTGIKEVEEFFSKPEHKGLMGKVSLFATTRAPVYAKMKAMHSQLLNDYRILTGSGANFSTEERALITDVIKKDFNEFSLVNLKQYYKDLRRTTTNRLASVIAPAGIQVSGDSLMQFIDARSTEAKALKKKTTRRIK